MSTFGNSNGELHYPNTQAVYGSIPNKSINWRKTIDQLEMRLLENPTLKNIRNKTGIPLVYILGILIMLSLIVLYSLSGIRAITSIVGVIVPGYMSLKALKDDNKLELWLSYWIWYGLFSLIESITDIFLFWIPMYEFMKMAFCIYLYAPNTKGALFLYRKILQPLVIKFQQYEQEFFKNVEQVKKNISDDSVIMDNTSKMNTTFPNYTDAGNISRSLH